MVKDMRGPFYKVGIRNEKIRSYVLGLLLSPSSHGTAKLHAPHRTAPHRIASHRTHDPGTLGERIEAFF